MATWSTPPPSQNACTPVSHACIIISRPFLFFSGWRDNHIHWIYNLKKRDGSFLIWKCRKFLFFSISLQLCLTYYYYLNSLQVVSTSTYGKWPDLLPILRRSTAALPSIGTAPAGSRHPSSCLRRCTGIVAKRTAQAPTLCRSPSSL